MSRAAENRGVSQAAENQEASQAVESQEVNCVARREKEKLVSLSNRCLYRTL